ncbi:ankyrin repeat domain-containing protein 2 isoform X2 [Cygnus olor]|uniref:ankyrin repeat domain-containing protein 2 isoform X2 n=1 Tax=Cygnus olor TaxID=8869 RepID=UPI001ADE7B1B|nr:ankyrin repeat domain-containing protein 2 isoform X2 [Cygnus olor]
MWSRHSCRCPWAAGQRGRRHKAPPPAEPPAAPGANTRGAEEEERPHPARGCARGGHGAGRGKGQGAHRPEAGGGGGGGEEAEGRWPAGAAGRGAHEHAGAGGGEAAGPPQQGHRGHQGEGRVRGAGRRRARRGRAGRRVSPQGQERVRRSSVDLRREIIDVGSIQRLIELRKQRRKRREERAATPEPPPPPEPPEIDGPVEPETFLRAAVQGKIRVIEKFLADGGPPDTCDEFHRTALHRSSLEGHTDILQKLLDSGATVDFRDRLDCTAVHWACRGGHLDAVKLLQDRGADLNLKDKLLSTPLHVATRTGHPDIVEHLIHCGADINSPDRVSAGPCSRHGGQRRAPSEGCHASLPGVLPSARPGLGWAPSPRPLGDVGAQTEPGCPAGGGHGAARRHAPQPLQDHQDADPARGRHDGQEPGGRRGARGCPCHLLPPRPQPVPPLAGWQDPDGAGAAVADGHAPGAGDQGAAAGGGRGPRVMAPGRDRGWARRQGAGPS